MSIIDSSVPEQHVAGYLAEVDTSEIGLFFSMAAEYNDRLHITVEPPLMIDGWLPFAASRNSLRLFRETGTLPAKYDHVPVGQFLEPMANSGNMLKAIGCWLDDCTHSHLMCQEPEKRQHEEPFSRFPARLLDVGPFENSDNTYVQLKENVHDPYIALSHCWGETRHIITEKMNIENHKRGIPVDNLPKTFLDAVELTKGIGLRYLWIDSLCIIQDDINDWKNEAAKMADVYRNAYCTVAATGSKSDQEGIFLHRPPQDVFKLRYDAANTYIAATYSEEDVTALVELHKSTLSTRAWTMQERLLSRRIVHFTRSRVIWECRTRSETEDGLVLGPDDFGSVLTRTLFEFSTTRAKWITSLETLGRERRMSRSSEHPTFPPPFQTSDQTIIKFSNLWYYLIADYSRRGLTKGTDKLIALAGLVQEAQEHTNLSYCAGIWLDMLHIQLSWIVGEDEPSSRAPAYRAPTWSWASIDGPVVPTTSYSGSEQGKEGIRSEIELLDSNVHVTVDGHIASAQITLRGRLRPGRLTPISTRRPTVFSIANDDPSDNNSNTNLNARAEIWLDPKALEGDRLAPLPKENEEVTTQEHHHQQPQSIVTKTYQLLHLSTRQWPVDDDNNKMPPKMRVSYNVLALEPIKGREGEFVRVGAGTMTRFESWFESEDLRRIKIS